MADRATEGMTDHPRPSGQIVTPQPGWYPDPQNPQSHHRWWDGQQWTHNTRPNAQQPPVMAGAPAPVGAPGAAAATPPPPAQPTPQPRPHHSGAGFAAPGNTGPAGRADAVDDTAFWTMIGLLPIAMLLTVLVPTSLVQMVTFGAMGANIGLATLDMQRNPWMERERSKALWLVAVALLVPVYVFMRDTSAPHDGRWRFWTYLGTLIAGAVLVGVVATVVSAVRAAPSVASPAAEEQSDVDRISELGDELTERMADHSGEMVGIESAIAEEIVRSVDGTVDIAVDCGNSAFPAAGETVTCSGLEDGQTPFTVRASVHEDSTFTWEIIASGISGELLGERIVNEIGNAVGPDPAVDCPSFDESVPGTEFTCSVQFSDGSSATINATVTDSFGGVDWAVTR